MITKLTSIDDKLIRGDDENRTDALEVSLYARHPNNTDLGLLHMTAGHNLKVSIEEQNGTADLATATKQNLMITELEAINTGVGSIDDKVILGQQTSANSVAVTIASDQISYGDGSTQTTLPRNTMYGCYNNTDLRSIKVDSNGRLLTQEEGVRTSGSETLNIPDATTGTSSAITMGTHKFIAFYGDTDNTTNTNIFIEYSQDGVNWFRGAGDNAKIIIVSATGNFYDEEHVTPPRIRISRPNTSGSAETLTLYYTLL